MATYTLSASGTQALSANVTAVHVTINTPSGLAGTGRATPPNYYDVALLRFGDAVGFWAAVPVNGGPQWIAVPAGATRVGYHVFGAASLTVVEVIGGTPPFGSPTLSLSALSDVAISGLADGDLLEWIASASKWENHPPGGSTNVADTLILDFSLASDLGAFTVGTSSFSDVCANQSFTVPAGAALLELSVGGYIEATGINATHVITQALVDGATAFRLGANYKPGSDVRPALVGVPLVQLGALAAGAHTVKVQVKAVEANVTISCRAATTQAERLFMRIMARG